MAEVRRREQLASARIRFDLKLEESDLDHAGKGRRGAKGGRALAIDPRSHFAQGLKAARLLLLSYSAFRFPFRFPFPFPFALSVLSSSLLQPLTKNVCSGVSLAAVAGAGGGGGGSPSAVAEEPRTWLEKLPLHIIGCLVAGNLSSDVSLKVGFLGRRALRSYTLGALGR